MRKKNERYSGKNDDDKMLITVVKQKKPWWKRLLLAPFKLLWWAFKLVLSIITLGYLNGAFDVKKN